MGVSVRVVVAVDKVGGCGRGSIILLLLLVLLVMVTARRRLEALLLHITRTHTHRWGVWLVCRV